VLTVSGLVPDWLATDLKTGMRPKAHLGYAMASYSITTNSYQVILDHNLLMDVPDLEIEKCCTIKNMATAAWHSLNSNARV